MQYIKKDIRTMPSNNKRAYNYNSKKSTDLLSSWRNHPTNLQTPVQMSCPWTHHLQRLSFPTSSSSLTLLRVPSDPQKPNGSKKLTKPTKDDPKYNSMKWNSKRENTRTDPFGHDPNPKPGRANKGGGHVRVT